MGKLVAFWSPYTGQAKVTSTMCAVAGCFAIEYPGISIALCQATPGKMELEKNLIVRDGGTEMLSLYGKLGISALALNYLQEMPTSEMVRNCAIPLFLKSLHLFSHSEKINANYEVVFYVISGLLVKEYDMVFLDLESGYHATSKQYMKAADLVVVLLPQSQACWDDFFKENAECLQGKKIVIVIGAYLEKSRYNKQKFVKRRYGDKSMLAGVMPMNAGYKDALEDGNVLHFLLRNQLTRKKEANYDFIFQAKKTAENIRKAIFVSGA